jgi:hypothetical protein
MVAAASSGIVVALPVDLKPFALFSESLVGSVTKQRAAISCSKARPPVQDRLGVEAPLPGLSGRP